MEANLTYIWDKVLLKTHADVQEFVMEPCLTLRFTTNGMVTPELLLFQQQKLNEPSELTEFLQ